MAEGGRALDRGTSASPLLLVVTPEAAEEGAGPYAALATAGQRLLAVDIAARLATAGAVTAPLLPERSDDFHWGRWFAAAVRAGLDAAPAGSDAIGYAGAGALALLDDHALRDLLSPAAGEAVANNRFSADAFVVRGDVQAALRALEPCTSDNAAARRLEDAGFAARDLSALPYSRFDVDTPLDLALLRLATRLPGIRTLNAAVQAFLATARLPSDRGLDVPNVEDIGAVMRDRHAELVVAGRVPASVVTQLEMDTGCRMRWIIEERGMRSAPNARPRSVLAALMHRSSPAELVAELSTLGDAAILDSRVLMAAVAGSSESGAWPPEEERFASDFGDASPIHTAWLRELVEAAADASVPFLLGGHALVSDGLRLLVADAWKGR